MKAYPTYHAQEDENPPAYGAGLHSRYPVAGWSDSSHIIATFYPAAEDREPEPTNTMFPADLAAFVFQNQM